MIRDVPTSTDFLNIKFEILFNTPSPSILADCFKVRFVLGNLLSIFFGNPLFGFPLAFLKPSMIYRRDHRNRSPNWGSELSSNGLSRVRKIERKIKRIMKMIQKCQKLSECLEGYIMFICVPVMKDGNSKT